MNVCEPIFDKFAIYDSYACRTGKGTVRAVKRCQFFIKKYNWYLKLDIKKYFDSIDHGIALDLLAKKIKDEELLLLFSKIFDTYHKKQNKGLPIGNLISQHVANYYLGYFDHWIKEKLKIKAYLRYMDDFILFSNSKEDLKNILEQVKQYLHEKLALELKNAIQLNRSSFGVPFLGFRIFPHRMNFTPNSKKRFVKKYRRYEYKLMTGQWSESKYVEHAEPLFSFALLGDTKEFRRNVIKRFGVSS